MRRIWLYALPLALAAANPMSAGAVGRGQDAGVAAGPAYAAAAPQGDTTTYIFKDVLRPHGQERGAAARYADARACGASAERDLPNNIPAFKKFMASRGWRFDHVVTTKAPVSDEPAPFAFSGAAGVYTYDDVLKPHARARGEQAEQAATRACDAGDPDAIGTAGFDGCMRARGWRLAHFEPAPPSDDGTSQAAQDAADEEARDDEQRRNDQQTQDMINTQNMVSQQQVMAFPPVPAQ